jgi:hypothetical protein
VFFALSKQAFANYYFLVTGALAAAAAAAAGSAGATVPADEDRGVGSRC